MSYSAENSAHSKTKFGYFGNIFARLEAFSAAIVQAARWLVTVTMTATLLLQIEAFLVSSLPKNEYIHITLVEKGQGFLDHPYLSPGPYYVNTSFVIISSSTSFSPQPVIN